MTAARVVDNLNAALHGLLAADPRVHLFGEDIADPYGGAFRVTAGLSTRYPDRVFSTPISEAGMVGVAAGMALCGDRPIVEVMFGDFLTLCFDQLVNFASKSVAMYGHRVPMSLVVRAAVGGHRGYGPTHSQSLQKHFLGVPHLNVFELSPFCDNAALFAAMFELGEPCLLAEDKTLYPRRMLLDGMVDEVFGCRPVPGLPLCALVEPDLPETDWLVICAGGMAHRAVEALRTLLLEHEIVGRLLVPTQLYPFPLAALLPVLRRAPRICVVEDASAGGTWGAELAAGLHRALWGSLREPVRLIHAPGGVIPAAPHLERAALVDAGRIVAELAGMGVTG